MNAIDNLRELLTEEIEGLSATVANGAADNYEAYKVMTTQIFTYRAVRDELIRRAIQQAQSGDEDDAG